MSSEPSLIFSSSTDQLMNNYMNALTGNVPERRSSAPSFAWSSPDSRPSTSFDDDILLGDEDLMLPDAASPSGAHSPKFADATVVSNDSSRRMPDLGPPTIITTSKGHRKSSSSSERRHSLPSTVMLSDSKLGNALTQPVPEFLCHLFTMLRDASLSNIISWSVPTQDETDCMGGGIKGIGKVVVHKPDALQEFVLGKYYRHSKYASFQRQLNYFGFKKRLHGGKKGKLSPCSYVHEGLDANVESLLALKRRPPVKKRASTDGEGCNDSTASVSSMDDEAEKILERPKKRRNSVKVDSTISAKDHVQKLQAKQVGFESKPILVQAQEYGAPSLTSSATFNAAATPFAISSNPEFPPSYVNLGSRATSTHTEVVPTVATSQQSIKADPAPASASLAQLLSTALPPTDVLFDDDFSFDFNISTSNGSNGNANNGFWVNDEGRCLSQNSLVNLAMFY
ncbi:hypothetical protein HJC23_004921 [Cyclotella cryptica]|uniref:HSF-type DNA-binding domain-containing protein n=1 Tax=Cyclotella cryptica TaxID=29204 RepID=A0ABD3PT90_9STRA